MDAVHFRDALAQEVASLTRSFTKYNREGFTIQEVFRYLFECTNAMADLGTRYMDVPHQQQKDEVIGALRQLYMAKNPDLPWVGEPYETMLEMAIFTYALPELYSVLFDAKVREVEKATAKSHEDEPELLKQLRETYETPEGKTAMAKMAPAHEESHFERSEPSMVSEENNAQGGDVEYSPDSARGKHEDDETVVPGQSGT